MGYQDKFVGTTSDSILNTEKFGFYGTVSRELAYILEQVNDVIRAVHEMLWWCEGKRSVKMIFNIVGEN